MKLDFENSVIKIAILGFLEDDILAMRKIEVLSQNKAVKLHLLPASQLFDADVLLINCLGIQKDRYSPEQWQQINQTTIISIDEHLTSTFSLNSVAQIQRPIQWELMLRKITEVYIAKQNSINELVLTELSFQSTNNTESDFKSLNSYIQSNTLTGNTAAKVPTVKKGKILLVDDSLSVRKYLSSFIIKKGFEVITSEKGKEAISILRTIQFDCILLDVNLPDIDGYQVCKASKKHKKELPVIFLTSKSNSIDKFWGKMAGCDAYLTKPTTAESLFEVIENLIIKK